MPQRNRQQLCKMNSHHQNFNTIKSN